MRLLSKNWFFKKIQQIQKLSEEKEKLKFEKQSHNNKLVSINMSIEEAEKNHRDKMVELEKEKQKN